MAKKATKKKAKTAKKKTAAGARKRAKKTAAKRSTRPKKTAAKRSTRPKAAKKKKVAKRKTRTPAASGRKATKKKATPARSKATKAVKSKTRPVRRAKAAPEKPELTPKERRAAAAAQRKRLRAFGKLLLQRREALLQAYHSTKGNTRDSKMDGTEDYIDYAVSSYDRDFTLSLTEMERKQLLLVEEALARVQRKEYGNCLNCQQPIPEKRLEVEPWARYCIRCQELEEQGLLEDRGFESDSEDEDEAADAIDGVSAGLESEGAGKLEAEDEELSL